MKIINLPGMSLTTGTAIADAVLAYSLRLVGMHRFDIVTIPVIAVDGTRRDAQVILGHDGLWTSAIESEYEEVSDVGLLQDLNARLAAEESWVRSV